MLPCQLVLPWCAVAAAERRVSRGRLQFNLPLSNLWSLVASRQVPCPRAIAAGRFPPLARGSPTLLLICSGRRASDRSGTTWANSTFGHDRMRRARGWTSVFHQKRERPSRMCAGRPSGISRPWPPSRSRSMTADSLGRRTKTSSTTNRPEMPHRHDLRHFQLS